MRGLTLTKRPEQSMPGLVLLWLVLLLVFLIWVPGFYTWSNLVSILQFSSILGLVTLGQTLVILGGGGGIDLSVGAMVSLSGIVMAYLVRIGLEPLLAALSCLAFGTILGGFNGVLVSRVGIPPIIVTLATFYVYGGLAVAVTGGTPVEGLPSAFGFLGRGSLLGVPAHVLLVFIPILLILFVVMTQTPFGRWVYAVGGNEIGARLAGIPVGRVRLTLYALSGTLAGIGAVIANSWLLSARPDIGLNVELLSITAVVLGGTSIFGGYGGLVGPVFAVYLLLSLQFGLQMANVNSIWQTGITGLILIVSSGLDRFGLSRKRR